MGQASSHLILLKQEEKKGEGMGWLALLSHRSKGSQEQTWFSSPFPGHIPQAGLGRRYYFMAPGEAAFTLAPNLCISLSTLGHLESKGKADLLREQAKRVPESSEEIYRTG